MNPVEDLESASDPTCISVAYECETVRQISPCSGGTAQKDTTKMIRYLFILVTCSKPPQADFKNGDNTRISVGKRRI